MSPNWIVAIDLSTRAGSLALSRDGSTVQTLTLEEGRHSETILTALSNLLNAEQLSIGAIGTWLLSRGPGSFTGLRIAFSTVKAFALVHPRPVLTVDGSEVRALEADEPSVCVLTTLTPKRLLVDTLNSRQIIEERDQWKPPVGCLIITDSGTESIGLKNRRIDSSASLLIKHFRKCRSLKRAETEAEIASLAPEYTGARFVTAAV